MDKFDQIIKNSKKEITPSTKFVDSTMEKIKKRGSHRFWNFRFVAPAIAGGIAILAIVFFATPLSSNLRSDANKSGAKTNSTSSIAQSTTSPATSAPTVPAGTDNATLDSYVSSISSSINQENSDQSAANTTLNDISQEITIPTN